MMGILRRVSATCAGLAAAFLIGASVLGIWSTRHPADNVGRDTAQRIVVEVWAASIFLPAAVIFSELLLREGAPVSSS
ncbi:MAG: hypothetical protein K2X97_15505 [Mycobacteriaceae bacterium]|nr:hypothetical protein [Mycobacteriaceae bacterium]